MSLFPTRSVICPILIGRTQNLTILHKFIDDLHSGKGEVALISGEAGIGKSRLVEEAKTYAVTTGVLLMQGNCFPTDFTCPYAPLLDLLHTYLADTSTAQLALETKSFAGELVPLLPELARVFPDLAMSPPPPTLAPEQQKRRLFSVLTRFFMRQALKQPVLLIFEDIHWSDDIGLEFFHYLARHLVRRSKLNQEAASQEGHTCSLILTCRSGEPHPGLRSLQAQLNRERLIRELPLVRLTRHETGAMLQAMLELPHSTHPDAQDAIFALTDGNPFFIEEILKSLIMSGEILYQEGSWQRRSLRKLQVPDSIQDTIQQRVSLLSEPALQLLRLAAVAGRRFDFALLQALLQCDEKDLLSWIKELIAAHLVIEESSEHFSFRHALTRQAIYSQLLSRERKILHRTIAETSEQHYASAIDASLIDLAYHFFEAGLWTKALEYAQQAGEKALSLHAPRAAVEQFSRALDAAQYLSLPFPSSLYQARGQAYDILGDFECARSDYESVMNAARMTGDSKLEWQSLISLGLLWAGRDYQQTGLYYQEAMPLAQAMNDPVILAHTLNRLGNWHMNIEQPQEAMHCHQEALSIFQRLQYQQGILETLDLLGVVSYISDNMTQSAAYYQQALALSQELGHRHITASALAFLMLGCVRYDPDTQTASTMSIDEAIEHGERALRISRELDWRAEEAFVLIHMGHFFSLKGDYGRARMLIESGLHLAEEIEHHQWESAARCSLGQLYFELFALEEAQKQCEQAFVLAKKVHSSIWEAISLTLLARTTIRLGDLTRAESLLSGQFDISLPPQTHVQRRIWCVQAELALAKGDIEQALSILDQLNAYAPFVVSAAHELCLPNLQRLRGLALLACKREEEAEAILQEAQRLALAHDLLPLYWRITLVLGQLYQSQRRYDEAEQAFTTVQEITETLAASISNEKLRERFLSSKTIIRPPSARRTAKRAFSGLTEREREVAALIAQGKSNREIAEVIVIGYRTVEAHVSNILSKLGFSSRAQIAVWATERDLC